MRFYLVDAEGFSAVGCVGMADVGRQITVNTSRLFEIGSVSKYFTALCVYRLADEGKVDLAAPLSRYLPDAPLPSEPILLQQMLSHTTGLPGDTPATFPRVPDGRLWTGFTPGTAFLYSDTAFELLGLLVQKVTGMPYPAALRELVIKPLGLTEVRESIHASDRADYAIGYLPVDNTAPSMTKMPISPALWVNYDSAAGNVAVRADAMSRYLQYLINVGQGHGGPLFSDAAAKRFCAPVIDTGFGDKYANGLYVRNLDDHTVLAHTGTMAGYCSALVVDPVSGVGCFANLNGRCGDYKPTDVANYAIRLLRHQREGGAAPNSPDASSMDQVPNAETYAGTYVASNGDRFQLVIQSGRLILTADGGEGRVQAAGGQYLQSDHPRFASHYFNFERSGDAVRAVWYGPTLYGRGGSVPQPSAPRELAALQGYYVGGDPWCSGVSVIAQGDSLKLDMFGTIRRMGSLTREGDYWRLGLNENMGTEGERIRFMSFQNGVPQCLNYSGRPDMFRFNKP